MRQLDELNRQYRAAVADVDRACLGRAGILDVQETLLDDFRNAGGASVELAQKWERAAREMIDNDRDLLTAVIRMNATGDTLHQAMQANTEEMLREVERLNRVLNDTEQSGGSHSEAWRNG